MQDDAFLTPPFQIDCANCVHLGKNVFANHGLTVMSVGTITIEDGVMMGPEVGLFTVNHEPQDVRVIYTGEITIRKNAWMGARVNIMPGVTIGEGAIVASGAVVTHDVEPHTLVAGERPAIKGRVKDMSRYDVIFVGVPVWWYTAPMPVFTFLEQYDFKGKTVIPFCTCYTAEYNTLKDLVKATPTAAHKDGLTIVTHEMGGQGMDKKHAQIDSWLKSIGY